MPWSGQRACRFAFEEWFWLKFGNENCSRTQHKPTNGYSCGVNQYFQATSHLFQKDGVSWFAHIYFRKMVCPGSRSERLVDN